MGPGDRGAGARTCKGRTLCSGRGFVYRRQYALPSGAWLHFGPPSVAFYLHHRHYVPPSVAWPAAHPRLARQGKPGVGYPRVFACGVCVCMRMHVFCSWLDNRVKRRVTILGLSVVVLSLYILPDSHTYTSHIHSSNMRSIQKKKKHTHTPFRTGRHSTHTSR